MQLTLFTDYALRTLIYLGTHPGEVVPASTISAAFRISPDHTVKATKWLTQNGYVEATRGQKGGLRLARPASSIRLGELIRGTEPHFDLLECFDDDANACSLSPVCRLKEVLFDARAAFFAVLDGYTLVDLLENRQQLLVVLGRRRG
jgi:Rrf2 family transcriptional regulator, nitric oxide-sensitive transcriptional repressor